MLWVILLFDGGVHRKPLCAARRLGERPYCLTEECSRGVSCVRGRVIPWFPDLRHAPVSVPVLAAEPGVGPSRLALSSPQRLGGQNVLA
jgi:hypothetical protein